MGSKKNRSYTRKKKFRGNQYSNSVSKEYEDDGTVPTVSETKLNSGSSQTAIPDASEKNIIFNLQILNDVFSYLCCPICLQNSLNLMEESVFGLATNMTLKCLNCEFIKSFCTSAKINKGHTINIAFVFALRIIGRGYSAATKLCSALDLNAPSKTAFRSIEQKLGCAASDIACEVMNQAATEIIEEKGGIREEESEAVKCGVSVDGSWQRRGYSSLNGCVTAISIDSGKVLDIEIMSKMCRLCDNRKYKKPSHNCEKHIGSSGSMEPIGAYRIFERSEKARQLHYEHFYGDGDSKAYDAVKDIYGKNSVSKYECIGHIQKRVGTRLRNLKKKQKGIGGKGKLTDAFIDKLQNYYGIAIRSNTHNLEGMQSAVIAVFFHCCSNAKQSFHGQCPAGSDSWCKYQRSIAMGTNYEEKSKGLPKSIMNIVKPQYMKLCDQSLLKKCLHGKTQNANESFNGILWKFVPKDIFVENKTLKLGAYLAVIQFNKGFKGLIDVLKATGIQLGAHGVQGFLALDEERVRESRRHSLPNVKVSRKKNRQIKKGRIAKSEQEEGITYKCGEF